jgi:hypothetical protein
MATPPPLLSATPAPTLTDAKRSPVGRRVAFAAVAGIAALGVALFARTRGSSHLKIDAPSAATIELAVVADCERYAKTFCDLYQRCDRRNFAWAYDDPKRCREATTDYCAYELGVPGSGDTPKDINECAEAFARVSCDDWGTHNTPAVCHPPGKRRSGEACQIGAQCESYFCDTGSGGHLCGKCSELPGEGDSCPKGFCRAGLRCDGAKCQKPKTEGEPCVTDYACAATLVCAWASADAASSTCSRPLETGAACQTEVDDANEVPEPRDGKDDEGADARAAVAGECYRREGDSCVAGKCTAEKRGKPGDVCTATTLCRGGFCDDGTCALSRVVGEKCDAPKRQCRYPAACVEGKCRLRDGSECDARPSQRGPP